jgi:pantoate kinase
VCGFDPQETGRHRGLHLVEPEVGHAAGLGIGPVVAELLNGLAYRVEFDIPHVPLLDQLVQP